MLVAAAITVASAIDYLVRALPEVAREDRRRLTRVFLTGGSGLIGGALATRLVERGDELVALARSDDGESALPARGARVVRGDTLDEDVLAGRHGRLRARLPRRRRQHAVPDGPGDGCST